MFFTLFCFAEGFGNSFLKIASLFYILCVILINSRLQCRLAQYLNYRHLSDEAMQIAILSIHVIVAVILVLTVLLQTGKGSGMGAAFGGGSSGTMFGSRGPATLISKITAVAAAIFMVTSFQLALIQGGLEQSSVMDDWSESAPIATPAPAASAAEAAPEVGAESGEAAAEAEVVSEVLGAEEGALDEAAAAEGEASTDELAPEGAAAEGVQ